MIRAISATWARLSKPSLRNSRLDLSGFFDTVSNIPYVAIKTNTPYMTSGFPEDYPVGKDIDLIAPEHAYPDLIVAAAQFSQTEHPYSVVVRRSQTDYKLRFETRGVLHYQIHVSTTFDFVDQRTILDSIATREPFRNLYIPERRYELVYRLAEVASNPRKIHHLDYIRSYMGDIDRKLLLSEELEATYASLTDQPL